MTAPAGGAPTGGTGGVFHAERNRPVAAGAPGDVGPGETATGPGGRLEAASQDFEAILIQEMLKAMRATVPDGGLIDGGRSQEVFSAMFDEQVARTASDGGRGSLATALYRQLTGGDRP